MSLEVGNFLEQVCPLKDKFLSNKGVNPIEFLALFQNIQFTVAEDLLQKKQNKAKQQQQQQKTNKANENMCN